MTSNVHHAIATGIYKLLAPFIAQPWSMQLKQPTAGADSVWWHISILHRRRIRFNALGDDSLYPVLEYLILFTNNNVVIKRWDDNLTVIYEGEYEAPGTVDDIVNIIKAIITA